MPKLSNPVEVYVCSCGWEYDSPVALSEPPAHRCTPKTSRAKKLRRAR